MPEVELQDLPCETLPSELLEPEEGKQASQPDRNPKYPNLVRPWAKGDPRAIQAGRSKGPKYRTLKSLEQWIRKELASKNGKAMEALAKSIIQGAIAREPACLHWLGDRLWKAEQGQETGKVIIQGIRLELPNPSNSKELQPREDALISVSASPLTDVEGKA